MKKLLPVMFIALLGSATTFVSCTVDDDGQVYQDQDTIAQVYELKNVNFDNVQGSFEIYRQFQTPLYSSDMVLIYRQSAVSNGNPVWELMPKTIYLSDGNEVDYTFDFSKEDVFIYAGGTFDLSNTTYVRNQTFRVVVIPAALGRGTNTVDYNDYNSVMQFYHLTDNSVRSF